MPSPELFIYYRICAERAALVQAMVLNYQAHLHHLHPGWVSRLLFKMEDSVAQEPTWMETYQYTDDCFDPQKLQALQLHLTAQAEPLTPYLKSVRRFEVFTNSL